MVPPSLPPATITWASSGSVLSPTPGSSVIFVVGDGGRLAEMLTEAKNGKNQIDDSGSGGNPSYSEVNSEKHSRDPEKGERERTNQEAPEKYRWKTFHASLLSNSPICKQPSGHQQENRYLNSSPRYKRTLDYYPAITRLNSRYIEQAICHL